MGLLDVLNGMQNGPRGEPAAGRGGMSKTTMALLAFLAYLQGHDQLPSCACRCAFSVSTG